MTVAFLGIKSFEIIQSYMFYPRLKKALVTLIEKEGACKFLLGGIGDFQRLAAVTLKLLKADYPHIKVTLVVSHDDLMYLEEFYDEFKYPVLDTAESSSALENEAIRYMISKSDCLVTCIAKSFGNELNEEEKMLNYAMENYKNIKIKDIFNLDNQEK